MEILFTFWAKCLVCFVSLQLAMDLAVALMELEEEAELYTDAKYAYGSFGRSVKLFHAITIWYLFVTVGILFYIL